MTSPGHNKRKALNSLAPTYHDRDEEDPKDNEDRAHVQLIGGKGGSSACHGTAAIAEDEVRSEIQEELWEVRRSLDGGHGVLNRESYVTLVFREFVPRPSDMH